MNTSYDPEKKKKKKRKNNNKNNIIYIYIYLSIYKKYGTFFYTQTTKEILHEGYSTIIESTTVSQKSLLFLFTCSAQPD